MSLKSVLDQYNVKAIVTHTEIEYSFYSEPIKLTNKKLSNTIKQQISQEEKEKRRIDSMYRNSIRAKNNLRRIIQNNLELDHFFTFTFEEVVDIKVANKAWYKFAKRLERFYLSVQKLEVKYVAVPEFQKRGSVHFHILISGNFVPWQKLQELWGNGFVYPKYIRSKQYLGYYITKYFTKSYDDPRFFGQKRFFTSRNIIKALIVYGDQALSYLILMRERLSLLRDYTIYNIYTGFVRKVHFCLVPLSP